jgi:adenylosuccinate synthase
MNKKIAVVGAFFGDCGKGKITDYLALKADCVIRYQGGDNAGHTVYHNDKKYTFHLLPSGVLNPNCINILSSGMVINPKSLKEELNTIPASNLFISDRAHLILSIHKLLDAFNEESLGNNKIGTTKRGIGPAYSNKASRVGIRVCDLFSSNLENIAKNYLDKMSFELKAKNINVSVSDLHQELIEYKEIVTPYVADTSLLITKLIKENKTILYEGAQGILLDIDHGTYPYVTSSHPGAASIPIDCGISPINFVDTILGITKAYTTRVGEGPFPTELFGDYAQNLRIKGNEFGATTKRPRRIGYLDLVVLKHSIRISGINKLAITLLDVLSDIDNIKVCYQYNLNGKLIDYIPALLEDYEKCVPVYKNFNTFSLSGKETSYNELSPSVKEYLKYIEDETGLQIVLISIGKNQDQTIKVTDI